MADDNRNQLDKESAQRLADGFVSKSGEVLGGLVKLPAPLALAVRAFQPLLIDKLTTIGEEPVRNAATVVARALRVPNAEKIGHISGRVAANALPYTLNIGEVVSTAKKHVNRKKWVLEAIAPLIAANKEEHKSDGAVGVLKSMFDNGYSDNQMVATALHAVKEETYSNLTRDAANLIPSFALNYKTQLNSQFNGANKQLETARINNINANEQLDGLRTNRNRLPKADRVAAMKQGEEAVSISERAIRQGEEAVKAVEGKVSSATMWLPATGLLGEELGKYFDEKKQNLVKKTSLFKVIELQEFIRSNGLDGEDRMASGAAVGEVAERVADIFHVYQKEQGHRAIPSHRLRDVSQMIAEELVGGDMHALSLVNIIGKDRLLNERKDGLVSTDKVTAVLKEEVSHFSKATTITSQEFLENAGYTLDDVKAHLQSKDKDERALVAILHPDSVLLEAGAKKEEIKEMRAHVSQKMLEGAYSAVLNNLNQQSSEQLKALGLDRRDMQYLEEHEGQPIQAGLRNKANEAQVKRIVSKALIGEEPTAWRDAIMAGKEYAASTVNAGKKGAPRGPMDYLDRNQETYR